MLVGQLDPSRGATYVAGYHSVDQRQDALKQLGIVPQFDVLYPNLSVKEHLQMYAAIKGVVNKDNLNWALHIAEKVALGGDLFDKPSKNLSGGMKRRLSIAIALLSDPKILFLDEPTTGLDPDMKRSIWEIVERMREGRCIILTTHAMDEAEALCDRIGIMAQGSLKCVGTPSHLRQRYGSTFELTFTVSLSEDSNALDEFLKTYSTTATLVSAFGQTRVFTMDKDQMDLTSLFTMLLKGQEDNFYTEWGISNTSLDEVFCAITAASEGANTNEF
jgi:ABC-type multidrug transport system ATPase subunit